MPNRPTAGRFQRSSLLPLTLALGFLAVAGAASATPRAVLGELFSADG